MTVPAPFEHQIAGATFALGRLRDTGGCYLNHRVGTGKSRTAIAVARGLGATRVVVLAPPVALGVWEREVTRWSPRPPFILPLRGDRWPGAILRAGTADEPCWALTNYEQLIGPQGEARIRKLLKWRPELVILDEAQYVKGNNSQRTRAARKLCAGTRRLLLSGTPAHSPLDLWAQFRIVAPDDPCWSRPFGAYKREVAILGGPDRSWVQGFRPDAVDRVFANHVAPYTHVVKHALDLPEPLVTPVPLDLSVAERRVYAEMERDLFAVAQDGTEIEASTVLVKALRLHQMTGGWVGPTRVGGTKLDACLDLLEQRAQLKTVVACSFRAEIDALRQGCLDRKIPISFLGIIDGRTRPEDRTEYEDRFQRDEGGQVLLLQYQAGGVAITLSKADALILYSLDVSAIRHEQMIGRVWRYGQAARVQVLPLLCNGTVDWTLWQGLDDKLTEVDLARRIREAARA